MAALRKLPPDEVIRREYYDYGLSIAEIAERHHVVPHTVRELFRRRGWTKARALALHGQSAPDIPAAPSLVDTPEKTIVRKEVMAEGRGFRKVWISISLPRIPTLHGHFAGEVRL